MKHIYTKEEAQNKLLNGINTVADIVKTTLGPCGSNVLLKKTLNVPVIVNDGVSIAREIQLEDPTENAGATFLTEAAAATNAEVGDGTTTTCILTQSLVASGFKEISKGVNPILLREELQNVLNEEVLPNLKMKTESSRSLNKLKHVATISVGGNKKYGSMIGKALSHVGPDGIVNLENSQWPTTTLDFTDGYRIERGYMTPYAVNNLEKFNVSYEDCLVLCCYHRITSISDLEPLLNWAAKSKKSILLILESIDENAFSLLTINLMRKIVNICPVKSPGFGFNVRDYMNDISKMTGCMVYAEDTKHIKNFQDLDFGIAEKVLATREYTNIIKSSRIDSSEFEEYVRQLGAQLQATENSHLKESLKERIAKLKSGVSIISVGAQSEPEQTELKLRLEDAINATRAAYKGGIVPGGGAALADIANTMEQSDSSSELNAVARKIMIKALKEPEKQLILNSGGSKEDIKELQSSKVRISIAGYNGKTKSICNDMRKAGIIDPSLVVKAAICNAVSVASTILTTQATIVSEDK